MRFVVLFLMLGLTACEGIVLPEFPSEDTQTISCDEGYEVSEGVCKDIDECLNNSNQCPTNSTCNNTQGSYSCTCNNGYQQKDGKCVKPTEESTDTSDTTDTDDTNTTDECSCDTNALCSGLECQCMSGFEGDGKTCVDIDECEENLDQCPASSTCRNTQGGYICDCDAGYKAENGTCTNINECEENPGICGSNANCTDKVPHQDNADYTCSCAPGYIASGTECVEIVIICNEGEEKTESIKCGTSNAGLFTRTTTCTNNQWVTNSSNCQMPAAYLTNVTIALGTQTVSPTTPITPTISFGTPSSITDLSTQTISIVVDADVSQVKILASANTNSTINDSQQSYSTTVNLTSGQEATVVLSVENGNSQPKPYTITIKRRSFQALSGAWDLQNTDITSQSGSVMAASSELMVIGVPDYGVNKTGGVNIFEWSTIDKQWKLIEKIRPTNTIRFGASVAVHGRKFVVGSLGNAAYVYQPEGNSWSVTTLVGPADDTESGFGQSVAISADKVAVGAPTKKQRYYKNSVPIRIYKSGAVYLYKQNNLSEIWETMFHLLDGEGYGHESGAGSSGQDTRGFGSTIALSRDVIVIGIPGRVSYVNNGYVTAGALGVYQFGVFGKNIAERFFLESSKAEGLGDNIAVTRTGPNDEGNLILAVGLSSRAFSYSCASASNRTCSHKGSLLVYALTLSASDINQQSTPYAKVEITEKPLGDGQNNNMYSTMNFAGSIALRGSTLAVGYSRAGSSEPVMEAVFVYKLKNPTGFSFAVASQGRFTLSAQPRNNIGVYLNIPKENEIVVQSPSTTEFISSFMPAQ